MAALLQHSGGTLAVLTWHFGGTLVAQWHIHCYMYIVPGTLFIVHTTKYLVHYTEEIVPIRYIIRLYKGHCTMHIVQRTYDKFAHGPKEIVHGA